ncbi:hypothetical protein BD770DRAFT_446760 [Pilaira anomala]|nr:hypothetical protein BD770DRAFT_446760 [Pilaira anomala]
MNVPKEIYLNIFQHIHKSDLLEVSLVCKEWNLAALQRYYHVLEFYGRNTHRLISIIDQDQYFQHCHWVKMVYLFQKETNVCLGSSSSNEEGEEEEVEENLTKYQLLKFLTHTPNLKILSLDATSGTDYVDYLLDLDESIHLKQLEKITFLTDPFHFDSTYDLRCDVYFKFRESLKELIIFHERRSNMLIQYGGISNYLSQFKNITHIKLINHSNQAVTVYQLQVACPKLTALEFSTNEQTLEHRTNDNAFLNTSNLKSLKLTFPKMSSSFVDMLIYYLPAKLIKFYIKLDDIDLFDWIKLIGIERVLKLAERMSKISSAKLQCELDEDYEAQTVHDESQMTLFFQILNAFKGGKNVLCTADFSDKNSIYQMMSYSNGVLNISYGLKYQDMYRRNQDGDTRSDFELVLPDKTVSSVGPEIFNRIKFCLSTTNDQLLTYKILNYSLNNCPHLQYVKFVGTKDHYPLFYLHSTSVRANFYSNESLAPLTKTEENIKFIRILHFVPSYDFINMLATYLPNISYLDYRSNHNEVTPSAFIDFSKLKNLEKFDLNVNRYCKLKINYIDEKVSHDIELDSIDSVAVPTLTLNFNKIMKLIHIITHRGSLFKIKYGVLQEVSYYPDEDNSYYFD